MKGRVWVDRRTRGKPVWKLIFRGLDGKTHWESTEATNRSEAKALLVLKESEIARLKAAGVKEDPTFKDFVETEYLPHAQAVHSEKGYESDVSRANVLIPIFGKYRLREITKAIIKQHVTTRKNATCEMTGRPYQNATINKEIMYLSSVFREAKDRGYVTENVIRGIKLFRADSRLRWLTQDEAEKLLKACARHLRPIVLTALHSGMRKSEILTLKWADVDFDQGLIRVRPGKTDKQRYIPMSDPVRQALDALKPDDPSWGADRLVFANPGASKRAGKEKRYGNVRNAFAGGCRRAGIEDFHFHDLRHTFASWLVQAGRPLLEVAELLGHGNLKMTMRYAHLAPGNLRAAVDVLNSQKSVALALQPAVGHHAAKVTTEPLAQ